jgi:glycosidase
MFKPNLKSFVFLFACSLFIFSSCNKDNNEENGKEDVVRQSATHIPSDIKDVVIYEANPKVFAGADKEGRNALNAITARLSEIKELGANVIWIMPIYEEGVLKGKGSPYCIKNYKKIDPKYGSLQDLKTLVKEAHKRDIAILMDWVANHTSFDNVWIDSVGWYTTDKDGNIIPPDPNWLDVADLNYNNQDMQNAMIDAMKYWVAEADIDGYRCDAADYIRPTSLFWDRAVQELRASSGKELLMFAEGNLADYFSAGFDVDFGWNLYNNTDQLFKGIRAVSNYFTAAKNLRNALPANKGHISFTSNHDKAAQEKNEIQLFNGERGAMSAFVLTATIGGTPLIYSTQEIAFPDNVQFFDFKAPETPYDYSQIDWDLNPEILSEYKKIMSVYNSNPALRKGNLETFADNTNIAYYTLSDENDEFLIAVNVRDAENTLTLPEQFVASNYTNLMDGTNFTMPETLDMDAYEYLILKKDK